MLSAVIGTVEALTSVRVLLLSLRERIDCSTPTGRMLAGIFTSRAEDEHELMHERATADLVTADLATSIGRATIYRALAGHRGPRPCALVRGCAISIRVGGALARSARQGPRWAAHLSLGYLTPAHARATV